MSIVSSCFLARRARLALVTLAAMTTVSTVDAVPPRVWIADQGNNQFGAANPDNRILEIDPLNVKSPADPDGTDVVVLNVLPSPALAFLDELTFDDHERLWTVVKDAADQDPDGLRRIDRDTGDIQISHAPTFPFEGPGSLVYLEGLAWDGIGLWLTGVRQDGGHNVLTRLDPKTGDRIAPFDSGPGYVSIPGHIAQGLLYDPEGTGFLWHSDVVERRIYKLDIADDFAVVKTFHVPAFPPKGMDFMGDRIWVAAPFDGIWEIDPSAPDGSDGHAVRLFNAPAWNLDGIAILTEPGPWLEANPLTVQAAAWIGANPAPDQIIVGNAGLGTVHYQVIDVTAPWVSPVAETGIATAAQPDTINVGYAGVDGFAAGVYLADMTLASAEALNSPITVSVELTVQTVGPDFDGDGDVDLDDFAHLQACFTGNGGTIAPGCGDADLTGNGAIDQGDVSVFVKCFSGAGIPAAQGCDL